MKGLFPPESFPGIRHAAPPLRPVLLWDGGCGFCALCVRRFHRLARQPVATAPVQPLLESLPPEVRGSALRQVILLEPGGEITGGVRAISRALRFGGRPRLAAVLSFPAVYPFARLLYRLIAACRGFFPGPVSCVR